MIILKFVLPSIIPAENFFVQLFVSIFRFLIPYVGPSRCLRFFFPRYGMPQMWATIVKRQLHAMTDNSDKINELLEKLEILLKRQDDFSREIGNLQIEINRLKITGTEQVIEQKGSSLNRPVTNTGFEIKKEKITAGSRPQQTLQGLPKSPVNKLPKVRSDLEKFIGENLINKIGIAITVIGVAVGAKYAIDHQLISPLTRIILGYLFGFGLLGFALKLKKKYENFSAVLLGGSMAIMYFITYTAYSFYGFIPQLLAFALMVIITAFTVVAAITYNRQVIAHIGMVGAYAVPFLLSDGSGKVAVLFSYMALMNIGILATAFKKYWKPLYYFSFGLTWLIYFSWYLSKYQTTEHFDIALIFLSIFFILFYLTFLAYKLLKKEKFELQDIILLLANSFIFYGIGYAILDGHETGKHLLGLFTFLNAIVHFIISVIIYRQKLADRNLFYLVSGLVLIFITIAIPVQLNGHWVTLLWAGEATLLFWIGRTKNAPVYEKLSYPLMILAFLSIGQDWTTLYDNYNPENPQTRLTPLFNINFLSSLLFIAAFGFINLINRNKKYSSPFTSQKGVSNVIAFSIPAILLFTLYYTFRLEIANYWNQLYADSLLTIKTGNQQSSGVSNHDIENFKAIWIINYSLLFVSVLVFLNLKKIRSRQLGLINFGLLILAIGVFLVQGLYVLSELRESYLEKILSHYYKSGVFNIGIRYISFVFVALALSICHKCIRQELTQKNYKVAFDFLLHVSVLWIASSELITWMDIAASTQSYKLGLSLLWGIYSLFLISLGIWKKKKHLRIGAIALFGVTLVKLFFYDISHLDTIAKTIVLVSLGVLLLIISFLYNKYKYIISNEN